MNCCTHNQGINEVFGEDSARDEVKAYLKKGLDKHSRAVVTAVEALGVAEATLLEVGGGIGGLHTELLKRGAASAVDVDISSAYVAAAQSLSSELGLRERVEYHLADFAQAADTVPSADIVILHRVVCCYPNMSQLVTAAAQHAQRALALSFPPAAWYMRVFAGVYNFFKSLTRSGFRVYIHSPEAIVATAQASGLRLVERKSSWPWQIAVFERGPGLGTSAAD